MADMYKLSSITTRLFLTLMLLISSIFGAIYWFTVPFVKDNVFELELHSNRQMLNIVYDLANRMYFGTEAYVEKTLESHQQRLRTAVDLIENHIAQSLEEGKNDDISDSIVWQETLSRIRRFSFGNQDYVWIANYDAILLSHPSDFFHNRDLSTYYIDDGSQPLLEILANVQKEQTGFYKYKWYKLNNKDPIEKYSFVKNFPEWGIIIGAGVYIDEIEAEVESQKQQAVIEIGKALRSVKIANNGYLYIFNSKGSMLFHPNANIHGRNFQERLNPITGKPIYQELIAAADTGQELYYKWDKPNDQGNYRYEKLSLVRHLPGFDWYIGSSVYLDDLKEDAQQLGRRIIAVGIIGLLATLVAAFLLTKWLTSPIKRLSLTAYQISRGNISAKTGIKRTDELGSLAESFDYMVDRLRDNISNLNYRVEERTKALSTSNNQLLDAINSLQIAQGELKTVEKRQRLILDTLPAQVAYLDVQERYIFANKEYLETFNQTSISIKNKSLESIVGRVMYANIKQFIDLALQGKKAVYEYPLSINNKTVITRRTVLPFYNEAGEVIGILNLSIDISNEKDAEKKLAEASKMKAVAQMSGGLAHDFNNLLTIILGNLLELQDRAHSQHNLEHNLVPAIKATRRGADMTKRLLAFSRKQPLSPTKVDPNNLIKELIHLLSAPLPENITLHCHIAQHISAILVDEAQIEDALVNLALNAADAMPQGGHINFRVSQYDSTELSGFDEHIVPGHYIMISVNDSGEGFSPNALIKACEPFYTTKTTGANSGLGLSMVYGFVKQSKGYLRLSNIDSKDHKTGANVDILLPAVTPQSSPPSFNNMPKKVSHDSDHDSKLILLVEDNNDVLIVIRHQLISLGYTVIEAHTGDEALQLIIKLPIVAGIVTDVVMPGESTGYDVIEKAKQYFPKAFTILMTGYSEIPQKKHYDYTLIQKPFDAHELADAIKNYHHSNVG